MQVYSYHYFLVFQTDAAIFKLVSLSFKVYIMDKVNEMFFCNNKILRATVLV